MRTIDAELARQGNLERRLDELGIHVEFGKGEGETKEKLHLNTSEKVTILASIFKGANTLAEATYDTLSTIEDEDFDINEWNPIKAYAEVFGASNITVTTLSGYDGVNHNGLDISLDATTMLAGGFNAWTLAAHEISHNLTFDQYAYTDWISSTEASLISQVNNAFTVKQGDYAYQTWDTRLITKRDPRRWEWEITADASANWAFGTSGDLTTDVDEFMTNVVRCQLGLAQNATARAKGWSC